MTEAIFHAKSLDDTTQMLLHSRTFAGLWQILMNLRALTPYHCGLFAFAVLLVLLHVLPDNLRSMLEYHSAEPLQLWRALTGHLLHSNHWHLLMNLLAFALIMLLHHSYYSLRSLALLYLSGAVLISLMLFLGSPDIRIYVGLSGWLHCLITLGAVLDIRHKLQSGWLILLGVMIKVGYEQWQGPDAELAQLIGANVAIDAHLYGLLSGLLCALLWLVSATPAQNQAKP